MYAVEDPEVKSTEKNTEGYTVIPGVWRQREKGGAERQRKKAERKRERREDCPKSISARVL